MRKIFSVVLVSVLLLPGCGKKKDAQEPPVSQAGAVNPAAAPAEGAGGVKGLVRFTGTAPVPDTIAMTADPVCAGIHPDGVSAEEVVVNENGTLANVFVYVKSGLEGRAFPPPTLPVVLDQKGCRYAPHVFGLQVKQPLQIVNSDGTLHNVHGMPTAGAEFNLGMPVQGMKLSRVFEKPDIMVRFKCDVHPWMRAYAGVLPHPFFTVTGHDGSFSFDGLPEGHYVIAAWHEKFGSLEKEIAVPAQGETPLEFSFSSK